MFPRCFLAQRGKELWHIASQSADVTLGDKGHREDCLDQIIKECAKRTTTENNNKILTSEYMCVCVAPSFAPVCLAAFGSSWTFSFWSHDFQGLERNNAALLWADWDNSGGKKTIGAWNQIKSKTFQRTCRQNTCWRIQMFLMYFGDVLMQLSQNTNAWRYL